MEKWKKERNYKRIRDKDGKIIANIITVFGENIAVSDKIFEAYSTMDRRARYIIDDVPHDKEVSLERLIEDGIHLEQLTCERVASPEDCYIEREQGLLHAETLRRLPYAINTLPKADRQLIHALFFEGVSTREYAHSIDVSQRTVIKRRDRILAVLKNILEKI